MSRVRWNFVDAPATIRLRHPIIVHGDMATVLPDAAFTLNMAFKPPDFPEHYRGNLRLSVGSIAG